MGHYQREINSWVLEKVETGWVVFQGKMGDRFVSNMHAFSEVDDAITFIKMKATTFKKPEVELL